MEIKSKDIELVHISKLIPYEKNMNKHSDEQIDRLVDIIKYQGWRQPIIAQRGTNIIASGCGRYLAAKRMGLETVPVMYQEFKNEEEFYAFVVSDNAIAAWADLDLSMINAELENLGPDFSIESLGLKDFSLDPWESDIDAIDKIKENDDGILGKIKITCPQDIKDEVLFYLKDKLMETSFDGVHIE